MGIWLEACCTVVDTNGKRANERSYFHSWFHCLDATVITAAFAIDVLLRGVVEEVGSLVVVLRLWRVFKVKQPKPPET